MTEPNANPGAKLVDIVHPFDTEGLAGWMTRNISGFQGSGTDLQIEQFHGGQSNPTYRVSTPDGHRYVLRRKPPGKLLPSAHAVDREFRIMHALAASEVPVPPVIGLCSDPEVIGSAFYLMHYLEGRILWDPTLPGMQRGQRAAHYHEINRVIAALHNIDPEAIGLGDFGKPAAFVQRQIERWSKQYLAGTQGDAAAPRIEAMDRLIEWLPQRLPDSDESSLTHGDFRIDNMIWHPDEPRVLAVLDWELSTLGHPLSDFAYLMMAWRLPAKLFRGMAGVDPGALGIPPEGQIITQYCRRTGRSDIPDFEYYLVFNLFRISAIVHGVWARAIQGNASSGNALELGQSAEHLADFAWKMARQVS